jgi:two-component sensor histidine kinase
MFGAATRTQIEGPALFLNANAVQSIGFALHELATNASKHGALSASRGSVLVSWSGPEPDDRIHLEWIEGDGPAVQSPLRQGFGYLVLTELVAQSLQGTAKLDFAPSGIQWRLDIPASHALAAPATTMQKTT